MAEFDGYRNLSRKTSLTAPYLLDVQAEFLDMLATRVVVPLIAADKPRRRAA
ncbi:MAG: CcdB family protein [Gammaproteobacteria bacterium]|nr:CcdB family protein [Gammaproteobacteria bacterium]